MTPGKWVKVHDGDVHTYFLSEQGICIGENKSYKDDINFSDRVIVIKPTGEVFYQYNSGGAPVQIKVSDEIFKTIVRNALSLAEQLLIHNA
jgi:hypothetical protein